MEARAEESMMRARLRIYASKRGDSPDYFRAVMPAVVEARVMQANSSER